VEVPPGTRTNRLCPGKCHEHGWCVGKERNDENGKLKKEKPWKRERKDERDSNGEDEKIRAENGRIKGDLKERTKEFALNIIGYSQLPKRREAQVSVTSYWDRAPPWEHTFGRRNEPSPIRISLARLKGGMQELEETTYWLELLEGARFCGRDQLEPLTNEADQLMAIFVPIVRKTKAGMAKRRFRKDSAFILAFKNSPVRFGPYG
jgi:hypothetical protein